MPYARVLLSGSTSGRPIQVGATATPGTLIHTAVAGADSFDEVFMTVDNVTSSPATLTVEWGGVTAPDDLAPAGLIIPPNSSVDVKTGQTLNGGLSVRAFSDTADALNITGYVNRITP